MACFPVERVVLLFGMMVGPTMAVVTVVQLLQGIGEASLWEVLAQQPGTKAAGAATVAIGLLLLVFVPLYLQVRAATRLTVGVEGVTFERDPVLPFGWLARSVAHRWSDLLD